MRPTDSLGATVRANQIVVLDDKHQLPPKVFFDRGIDNELGESDEADEEVQVETAKESKIESILKLCVVRTIRSNILEWHYRSHDPLLIRVSNYEFYEDYPKLPPSTVQMHDDYGLKFTRVAGIYSS